MRLRRLLLILVACWLLLSTAWLARRWYAVQILLDRLALQRGCDWHLPFHEHIGGEGTWLMLLPTSYITAFTPQEAMTYDPDFVWALRVCGRLERLALDPIENFGYFDGVAMKQDPREIQTFLAALGPQPSLRVLELWKVDLGDQDLAALLRQYPRLRELSLNMTSYSGTDFPLLPALETVTIQSSPITDAGLAAILRSPALRTLDIAHCEITRDGILRIPQHTPPTLETLRIIRPRVTASEAPELTQSLRERVPKLSVDLTPRME